MVSAITRVNCTQCTQVMKSRSYIYINENLKIMVRFLFRHHTRSLATDSLDGNGLHVQLEDVG